MLNEPKTRKNGHGGKYTRPKSGPAVTRPSPLPPHRDPQSYPKVILMLGKLFPGK